MLKLSSNLPTIQQQTINNSIWVDTRSDKAAVLKVEVADNHHKIKRKLNICGGIQF